MKPQPPVTMTGRAAAGSEGVARRATSATRVGPPDVSSRASSFGSPAVSTAPMW